MVDKQYLLNTKQMAQFVAAGFLRFDELVPDEINRAACAEMETGVPRGRAGAPARRSPNCGPMQRLAGSCACPRSRGSSTA